MIRYRLVVVPIVAILLTPVVLWGQVSFDKVEIRTSMAAAKEGDEGRLIVDGESIKFVHKKGAEYFTIPTSAVKELFYSRVSGRRIGAAIMVTPLLLFSKGRKHYMTLSFNDKAKLVGAVEFKLHKSNYRPILRAVEEVTKLTMQYDQEGVKETEQKPAERKENP
jgi:hypothetical protein